MSLPASDLAYLTERGVAHEVVTEAGMICVVFLDWPLPPGYDHAASTLLLRLSPGYPDVAPDMWWFSPALRLASGEAVPATDVTEYYLGRQWQRWSRHFTAGQWRSGMDGLESYLALIRRELVRAVPVPAP